VTAEDPPVRKKRNGEAQDPAGVNPNGPEHGTVASVPFMITQKMKAKLRARGYSDAELRAMTPEQAHGIAKDCDQCGYPGRLPVDGRFCSEGCKIEYARRGK
jgi:hypothetical protein